MGVVYLSKKEYEKLKKRSERTGVPIARLLVKALKRAEVRRLEKKEEELDECQECGAKVPKDSVFCPYCGVEFEEEEEEEEEE